MSSVSSTNPGLSYLTNMLSGSSSPLVTSGMSSSQVQSALQTASPTDIVQLSDQALQLQNLDVLFAPPETSQSTANQSIDNLLATPTATSATPSQSS